MDRLFKHIKEYFNTFNNNDYTIYVDGIPTKWCGLLIDDTSRVAWKIPTDIIESDWHFIHASKIEKIRLTPTTMEIIGANGKEYKLVAKLKEKEEKPKYDPYRLFKKGDIVRVVEWNGRVKARTGMEGRVVGNERNSMVELAIGGWKKDVFYPACHLELITPVEEREPYSVKETMSHDGWQIVRDGLPLAIYDSQRHPNAKAAAEAERDRLNAEYRKNYEQ